MTATALELPSNLPLAQARAILRGLGKISRGYAWWLGDLLNHSERHYGQEGQGLYREASDLTGYEEQTLRVFAYVAGRVSPAYP